MKAKLTARYVENLKPPEHGRISVWDQSLPGFGVRVSDTGRKVWVCVFRHEGRQRRMTIGKYPVFSLAEAREEARNALRSIGMGIDPTAPDDKRDQTSLLFRDVVEEFVELYAKPRNRSWNEAARCLRVNVVPHLGQKPIDQITKRDITAVLDWHLARGVQAVPNRTLAHVRKLFNWCVDRGLLEASPASGIKALTKETSRERVLTDEEIAVLWPACEAEGWPFGPLYQVLLLTGQRRGEVASMRWSDIQGRDWTIPAEKSKNGLSHTVYLSDRTVAILEAVPRISNQDLIFCTNGRNPISGFSKAKKRIDEATGFPEWRVHDLRRTAASGMARLGIAPHVVEKVLNHSSGSISGVAAVYNRYGYDSEKRDALCSWAAKLDALLSDVRSDEVSQKPIDRTS